jgi:Trk-type K+ transport system membrane component
LLTTVIVFYDYRTGLYNPPITMLESFFESASAFGTVGLSMGITAGVGVFAQIMLVILMFVGQLGISTTLLSFTRKQPKGNDITYPEEHVKVG